MLDIFSKIFDGIFPQPESIKKLRAENQKDFIKYFSPHRFANCITLSDYSNPIIKAAITANKFNDYDKAASLLSTLIEHWLNTQPPIPTIFVPIPLSSSRYKSRGYNQVTRILEKIKADNVTIQNILTRDRDTKTQTSLSRIDRFKNVERVFTYSDDYKEMIYPQRIVLVDDVITTGATMFAAKSVLMEKLPSDCELICLALAH